METLFNLAVLVMFMLALVPGVLRFYDKYFNKQNVMTDEDMIRRYTMRRIKKW